MFANKKSVIVLMLSVFVAVCAIAQSTNASTTALLQRADDAYTAAEYQKAFGYINAALKMNEGEYKEFGVAPNVALLARQTYRKLLQQAAKTKNYNLLDDVNGQIEKFPDIADEDLNQQIKRLQNQRSLDQRAKEREEDRKANESLVNTMAEKSSESIRGSIETLAAEQRQNNEKLIEQQAKNNEKLAEKLGDVITENNETLVNAVSEGNHTVLKAILIICAILVVVFIIVIFSIISSSRAAAKQREQFDATLKLVAGMQQQSNQLLLGGVTDLAGLRSAGSSRWGMDALPAPEMNDEEKLELKELAIKCEELGSQIDQISKRKNNSKNVSELVFKLSTNLGLNQNTSMMYFCSAMVYDIGFLSMPEELLNADDLTDEQRQQLRDHLTSCDDKFDFVPEKYRQIFIDASKYHNENMDGTGYPKGLEGTLIPQIARLIHVAESYNALISRRSYRMSRDKESAIEEMKSKPGLYDPDVVAVLDAIV